MVTQAFESAVSQLRDACPWDPAPTVALADAEGRIVAAEDERRAASLEAVARFVRDAFAGDWAPGDVVLSNDPFVGCADVTELTLVHGAADGFALARVRIPDIGGFRVGGVAPEALDIWGDGARFPALRIAIGGAPRSEGRALLLLNSRTPKLVDRALDALSAVAAKLAQDLPVQDGRAAAAQAARDALRTLTPGTYRAEAAVELPGRPAGPSVRVTLEVGEDVRLGFADSDAVVELPVNSSAPHTLDCCLAELADAIEGFPTAPGALGAVAVDPGAGTIAGAALPAATSLARHVTARAIREAVRDVVRQAGGTDASEGWWEREGRRAFEARIDPDGLCLRPELVAATLELERNEGAR